MPVADQTILSPLRLPGTTPLGDAATPAAPPRADGASFQRLLESLQQLAESHRNLPQVADAEQLRDAIKTADDGFVTAMNLRRQLEAAFRARQP